MQATMSKTSSTPFSPSPARFTAGPSPVAHRTLEMMLQRKVHVTYVAGLFPALSETFVYREVRELRRRGWDVSAVSLNDPDRTPEGLEDLAANRGVVYGSGRMKTAIGFGKEFIDHPLNVARTLWIGLLDAIAPGEPIAPKERLKLIGQAAAGIGLAGRLRDGGTRHIHCHFAHAPASVGMYAAITLGVPFSFTGHANDLFQRRLLLKRKLERAAFVACISDWHRQFYQSVSPADDADYPVIRCGVDTTTWTYSGEQARRLNGGVLRVSTVCRLVEKKGVDTLLRAMRQFGDNTGRAWQLTIAGDGPQRAALVALTKELSISNSVVFVGPVANEQVRDLLGYTDVFALPCRPDAAGDQDGIPVVLMEAMAAGVAVVAGDLPALAELVNDQTGLRVDGNDPAAVATAIGKLALDQSLRTNLARAGRARVENEFDLRSNVTRLERRIEQTLAGNRFPADATAMDAVPSRRYALITPCRDEAKYARRTLDSVTKQTVPPSLWVIVDDGSKDDTPKILAEYAAKFPYIKVITRQDRGDRKLGGGVIDAFYTGYDTIDPKQFDYVCKFDLDLDLPLGYFAELMRRMESNPRIGTASGKPYFVKEGRRVMEVCGDENSVGMIKFYRTACFQQIGGFVRELMWDGIDCHRCRMDGWIAVSWDDPALNFEHLRPMGTSHKSWWTGRVRHGVGQYFMGTSPAYMLASAAFRLPKAPVVLGSTAMVWGYLKSAWERKPRYGDAAFRKFLRSYQWDSLLRGKTRATERLNRKQSAVFRMQDASTRD